MARAESFTDEGGWPSRQLIVGSAVAFVAEVFDHCHIAGQAALMASGSQQVRTRATIGQRILRIYLPIIAAIKARGSTPAPGPTGRGIWIGANGAGAGSFGLTIAEILSSAALMFP